MTNLCFEISVYKLVECKQERKKEALILSLLPLGKDCADEIILSSDKTGPLCIKM